MFGLMMSLFLFWIILFGINMENWKYLLISNKCFYAYPYFYAYAYSFDIQDTICNSVKLEKKGYLKSYLSKSMLVHIVLTHYF